MASGIRLLVSDVDGTLVTSEKILIPRVIDAAHDLRHAGIRLALTSGRPPRGMAMLIEPLQIDSVIAGFNGGIYARPDLSIIETRTLPVHVARQACRLLEQAQLDVWLYDDADWYVRNERAPHVAHESNTVQFTATVVPRFDDGHFANVVKLVGVSDDHDAIEAGEALVRRELGDAVSATQSQPYYLDVTHPDANKGSVIRTLSRDLNIPLENIAAIGDGANDALMFKDIGLSIAMGNASDAVKAQAACVTSSNNEDGFAEAVRRFILDKDR